MTVREHVLNIILDFWKNHQRLTSITTHYLARKKITKNDRHRITVLTREIIRWTYRLDCWLEFASKRPLKKIDTTLLAILELAIYELTMDPVVPPHAAIHSAVELAGKRCGSHTKGFVNGILRTISRTDENTVLFNMPSSKRMAHWNSYQPWMVDHWKSRFGESKIENVLSSNNTYPPMTVRINPTKISSDEFLTLCAGLEVDAMPAPNTSIFFNISHQASRLLIHEYFSNGYWSVQDRGAGMIVELLNPKPGETILDVCAAPGTKSVYMAELMQNAGTILASDMDMDRVEHAKSDGIRHNMTCIQWDVKDASHEKFEIVDKILIDAPCTGTGVIRRKPDIKWRRKEQDIEEMVKLQFAILSNMSGYVKYGGTMVYGTCSMEYEENMGVVESFLEHHADFSIDDNIPEHLQIWKNEKHAIETFPHSQSLDGMFGIRLVKNRA